MTVTVTGDVLAARSGPNQRTQGTRGSPTVPSVGGMTIAERQMTTNDKSPPGFDIGHGLV